MRRALLVAVPLALGVAAPASAADQVVVGRDTLDWDRPTVAVQPGESVTWTFPGTVQVHNVAGNGPAASDPNWDAFASPFGAPAPDATGAPGEGAPPETDASAAEPISEPPPAL